MLDGPGNQILPGSEFHSELSANNDKNGLETYNDVRPHLSNNDGASFQALSRRICKFTNGWLTDCKNVRIDLGP